MVRRMGVVEDVLSAVVPEALMQVSAAAVLCIVPFGHKAGGQILLHADLFRPIAEEHRAVGGDQWRSVAQVHLIHAGTMLAVVALDVDAALVHQSSDFSDDELVPTGAIDAIAA